MRKDFLVNLISASVTADPQVEIGATYSGIMSMLTPFGRTIRVRSNFPCQSRKTPYGKKLGPPT